MEKGETSSKKDSTSSIRLKTDDPCGDVARGLARVYNKTLAPIEEKTRFNQFLASRYDEMDFESKPLILVVGPYSVGKSTLIKYLIGSDYPDINIGSEPTTDRFIIVMKGPEKKVLQGHALVNHKGLAFRTLHKFGNTFLSKMQASMTPDSGMLEGITFVDTPGILSGQQTSAERGYDYTGVMSWFAERADRILVMFDAHKLDISDEFDHVLGIIRPHSEKLRFIFNKADTLPSKELVRIYGSLMWGLGKSLRSPEAARIYMGSFWNQPYVLSDWEETFEEDRALLFDDLRKLPHLSASRKIGDLTKRIKLIKAYALTIADLLDGMPMLYGKEKKKAEKIKNLETTYVKIQRQRDMAHSDFPDAEEFKKNLSIFPWEFKKLSDKELKSLDKLFEVEIPALVDILPEIGTMKNTNADEAPPKRPPRPKMWKKVSSAGDLRATTASSTAAGTEELQMPGEKPVWIVKDNDPTRFQEWERIFQSLQPDEEGKVEGRLAKAPLQASGLDKKRLHKIWEMADMDKDGKLTLAEFAIANFLVSAVQEGETDLPDTLPDDLLPPVTSNQETTADSD